LGILLLENRIFAFFAFFAIAFKKIKSLITCVEMDFLAMYKLTKKYKNSKIYKSINLDPQKNKNPNSFHPSRNGF
jgi:hypothetical protein